MFRTLKEVREEKLSVCPINVLLFFFFKFIMKYKAPQTLTVAQMFFNKNSLKGIEIEISLVLSSTMIVTHTH